MADHRDERNKVPTWDGDGTRFQEYKERVKWYVAGLSYKDKGVAGARLAAALTGEAWKALEEVSDEGQELLEKHGGHKTLLNFLDDPHGRADTGGCEVPQGVPVRHASET